MSRRNFTFSRKPSHGTVRRHTRARRRANDRATARAREIKNSSTHRGDRSRDRVASSSSVDRKASASSVDARRANGDPTRGSTRGSTRTRASRVDLGGGKITSSSSHVASERGGTTIGVGKGRREVGESRRARRDSREGSSRRRWRRDRGRARGERGRGGAVGARVSAGGATAVTADAAAGREERRRENFRSTTSGAGNRGGEREREGTDDRAGCDGK